MFPLSTKALLLIWGLLLCFSSILFAEYRIIAFSDNISLYTDSDLKADYAAMLNALDEHIDALQMSTGIYLDKRAEIFIVPDRESYQKLALGKERIVEFSDAFYSSSEGRIYIRSAVYVHDNYFKILLHEYMHWFLDEVFSSAPLWFHEGMATRFANQLGYERYLYFMRERFWGNDMNLFKMSYRYPEEEHDWQMYYLHSYFAVKYMQERDEKAWNRFWSIAADAHRRGEKIAFTPAFNMAFDLSLFDFQALYSRFSKKLAYQYLFIAINSVVFTLLPFVLVIAALRRKRRMHLMPDLPELIDAEEDEEEMRP
ncbi:MAG: hypothetical protein Q8M98_06675 [Candidatus Cloacimonadaceae bacterium]|nr:hypothetical protein [Candidatus Cloacimonadaceae bacterium]MDP3114445.1 hypothetical protein [Candidatus Cloacimonadaceae bacterium]